jgi:hypothetical protein
MSMREGQWQLSLTVFSSEHKTDRTTCLSEHVAIYVMALTPFTGRIPAPVNTAPLLERSGRTAHRLTCTWICLQK